MQLQNNEFVNVTWFHFYQATIKTQMLGFSFSFHFNTIMYILGDSAVERRAKGHLAIRRLFSLKSQIFELPRCFCSLHEIVRKYISFLLVVVWQQSIEFKFVKNCIFRTHSSFYVVIPSAVLINLQVKGMVPFARHLCCNVDHINALQCQNCKH